MVSRNFELLPGVTPHQTIPEYFRGKSIFMTGGSGFMGKVLIEKLLWSCPELENIYILIRSKKGVDPQERCNQLLDSPVFNRVKEKDSALLSKIKPVNGDVSQLGLGLSAEDRQMLINKVHLVYHVAATINFTDTLKKSTIFNVRGTREMCNLVLEMKNLEVFLYVSTAYCQGREVQERTYEGKMSPQVMIKIAEEMDEEALKLVTAKLMEGFFNTYQFTKHISETVVKEMCEGKIPAVIYRPTIVMGSLKEPMPGWCDTKGGPHLMALPIGHGVLRVVNYNTHGTTDFCPVDASIQGIIKATWIQQYKQKKEISVYVSGSSEVWDIPNNKFADDLLIIAKTYLKVKPFWYPSLIAYNNLFLYWMFNYLFQIIPSLFLDAATMLVGLKPRLLDIQVKILHAGSLFNRFNNRQFTFKTAKFRQLDNYLLDSDEAEFANEMQHADIFQYFLDMYECFVTQMVPKKEQTPVKENLVYLKRLKYVYYTLSTVASTFGLMFAYYYILEPLINCSYIYINSL